MCRRRHTCIGGTYTYRTEHGPPSPFLSLFLCLRFLLTLFFRGLSLALFCDAPRLHTHTCIYLYTHWPLRIVYALYCAEYRISNWRMAATSRCCWTFFVPLPPYIYAHFSVSRRTGSARARLALGLRKVMMRRTFSKEVMYRRRRRRTCAQTLLLCVYIYIISGWEMNGGSPRVL